MYIRFDPHHNSLIELSVTTQLQNNTIIFMCLINAACHLFVSITYIFVSFRLTFSCQVFIVKHETKRKFAKEHCKLFITRQFCEPICLIEALKMIRYKLKQLEQHLGKLLIQESSFLSNSSQSKLIVCEKYYIDVANTYALIYVTTGKKFVFINCRKINFTECHSQKILQRSLLIFCVCEYNRFIEYTGYMKKESYDKSSSFVTFYQ